MGVKKLSNKTVAYEKISKIDGDHPLMDLSENILLNTRFEKEECQG